MNHPLPHYSGQVMQIWIVAEGWDRPWPDLYADDLPPEWRLACYASQLRGVALPLDGAVSCATIAAWVAEVVPGFYFFPLLTGAVTAAQLAAFGDHLGGVVTHGWPLPAGEWWVAGEGDFALYHGPLPATLTEQRLWLSALQASGGAWGVAIIQGEVTVAALSQAQILADLLQTHTG
jgi:hypothetical protein